MQILIARFAPKLLTLLLVTRFVPSLSAQEVNSFPKALLLPGAPPPARVVSVVATPSNWRILGTEKYSPESIRRSVVQHPEYLELSYQESNPADFVAMLKQLIERGYRHKGYAEVSVAVAQSADGSGLTIRIHEGPRYKSGGIEIVGARNLDPKRIVEWCRTVVPKMDSDFVLETDKAGKPARVRKLNGTIAGPENAQVNNSQYGKPIWRAGEDITFARSSWDKFNTAFKQSLEAQGYYHVRFECMAVPDPKTKTGKLRVLIQEEGPRVRVGDISVEGLTNIDRQKLLDFVELKSGQFIGSERCREIEARLRRSGRFVRFNCLVVPRILEPELADVFIDVRETVHAKPIDQPLSESETTILSAANWLEDRKRTGHDLILQLDLSRALELLEKHSPDSVPHVLRNYPRDSIVQMVVSADGDMVVELRDSAGKVHGAVLLAGKELFLKNADFAELIDFGDGKAPRPMMQLVISGLPANPATNESSFLYGFGVQSDQDSTKIELLPAAGIRELGEKHIAPVKGKPGEFDVPDLSNSLIRIDPATGRLIEARLDVFSISTRKGEFQKKMAAMRAQFSKLGVVARKSHKNESWNLIARAARASVDWIAASDPDFESGVINRLATQQVWEPVLLAVGGLVDNEKFNVPADGQRIEAKVKGQLMNLLMGMMLKESNNAVAAQVVAMVARMMQNSMTSMEIFPYASIPWQVNRDVELLMTDRSAGTVKLTDRLKDADFGPVSGVYTTLLMRSMSAQWGKFAAAKTLTKIDDFRKDREWLLKPGSLSQALLLTTAEAVRRLSSEETVRFVKAISGQDITPAQAAALRATLPDSLAEPVEPAMPGFTDSLWKFVFRPQIRSYLEQFILEGAPLEKQAQQVGSWAHAKQKAREYEAAEESFKRSLSLYEQHLKEADIPRDSRQARHIRATLLYMLAMNHDLRTAERAELMQVQIETGEAIAERLILNAGVKQASLALEDEQAGAWQLARLYGVSGVIARWLGQESVAYENLRKSLALYKNRDAKINKEYAAFVSQYALLLASANDEKIRNVASAVKLAKSASDLLGKKDAHCLVAHAACLAASGDYGQACFVQGLAINKAGTLTEQLNFKRDLKRYQTQKTATPTTIDLRMDLQTLP